jgi:hypothetical protein
MCQYRRQMISLESTHSVICRIFTLRLPHTISVILAKE